MHEGWRASVGVTAGYVRNPQPRRAGLLLARLPRFACAARPGRGLRSGHIRRATKEGRIPAERINEELRFDTAAVRLAVSNNARAQIG